MEFTELDPATLAELEATTRQSGFYKQVLTEFANSGVNASDVTDSVVTGERKVDTVEAGLKRHANEAGVRVLAAKQADGSKRIVLVRA